MYYNMIFNIALGELEHLKIVISAFELPRIKINNFCPKCSIPCPTCSLYKKLDLGHACSITCSVRNMINRFPFKRE